MAFVTITLVETSFIVIYKRCFEFYKFSKGKINHCSGTIPPLTVNGVEDIEENAMKNIVYNEQLEHVHTSDKIDAGCFIGFLTCYVTFLSTFMYSLLNT